MAPEHALGARRDVRGRAARSACSLAPYMGFWGDLAVYRSWVTRLHDVGLHDFYGSGPPAEYPPGYLYVLWLISHVSTTPGYLLLKLPRSSQTSDSRGSQERTPRASHPSRSRSGWPVRTLVAAAVLFNPAVLALSAVLGPGRRGAGDVRALVAAPALHGAAPPAPRDRRLSPVRSRDLDQAPVGLRRAGDAVRALPPLPPPAVALGADRRRSSASA